MSHLRKESQRILITGGAGFIGSHLAEALLARGCQVSVIDDLSTGRYENIAHLTAHPRFHFVHDTIFNAPVLDELAGRCDAIFHLAAAVGVMLIVDRPVHTLTTNVIGTEAVLKAATRHRVKVLLASTSEVYGKGNRIPFSEDDDVVLGPTSRSRWSYAASKMVDEFLALAYHREKSLPVVIFRLFNTIGPRQTGRYGMVIPRFIEQALNGEPLTVYGDGQQARCFLHVGDAVAALLCLMDCPQAVGQVFNVGSQEEITMEALARLVLKLVRKEQPVENGLVYIPYDQAYAEGFEDMRRRVPDISKVFQLTGWQPTLTIEENLKEIILWWQNQL